MSTDFRTEEKIQMADLFDGRLERLGVREHVNPRTTWEEGRCLTDGRNYLWAYSGRDGMLGSMSRYGQNDVDKILRAVAETFETGIYTEHEPQFWGFPNKEAWELAGSEMEKKAEGAFHADIIAYVKGEPNDLNEGTVGMEQAKLAKNLVAVDPHLSMTENEWELLDTIDRMYCADKRITLTEQQIERVKLSMTREPPKFEQFRSRTPDGSQRRRSRRRCGVGFAEISPGAGLIPAPAEPLSRTRRAVRRPGPRERNLALGSSFCSPGMRKERPFSDAFPNG